MRRNYTIKAMASCEEYQAWLAIAQHQKRKPTETLREMVREQAKALGLWPPAANTEPQSTQGKED